MTMPSPPTTMTLTAIAILLLGSLHVEAFMSSRIVLQRPVQVQASFLPKLKRPSPKELLSPGLVLRLASGDGTLDGLYNITSEDISNCVDTSGVPSGSLTSPWVLPNSFELFLTQCSIQSFVFLLKSLHDPHTVMWVESFTQPSIRQKARPGDSQASQTGGSAKSKLLTYHGLAAFNTTVFPTWDSYFSKLLEQPMEMYIIESHSGLAPEYELEIKPASLCARIVSVREQIAREFVRDLGVIAAMGGHTLESHWESLKENREIQRENLFFLEMSLNVGDMDYAPSPLRKGNFDLLVLLTTQESIHRVLNDPDRQSGVERVTNHYLRNFYAQRLVSHFSGNQRYGRADDFLEELLGTPPSVVQLADGSTSLIDTHNIAELILKEREALAWEWKELARNAPHEHMEIKRLQLNLLMGIANKPALQEELQGFE